VILTGNAVVVQQGKGEFHGEKLVYNTDTGEIQGSPVTGGRVHITLQPRSKPAPASTKPAATGTPAASAPVSAPASASAPATSAPASAATTGTH
jgi:lipopolysaccharide export system protein LptA